MSYTSTILAAMKLEVFITPYIKVGWFALKLYLLELVICPENPIPSAD
jgi:hypothetical protein